MDKDFYQQCVYAEVYKPYQEAKKRLNIIDKIWCRYFNPELNAMFLIRKMQYLYSRGGVNRAMSRFIHVKLIRRYGIHINPAAKIGIGLKIKHAVSIVIGAAKIGENFTVYQLCTVGSKENVRGEYPRIGDGVVMYAGSSVIGAVEIGDEVIIGANTTVVKSVPQKSKVVGGKAMILE